MRLPEMLAELEAERAQLDVAINALRLVADRTAAPVPARPRKARKSSKRPAGRKAGKRLPRPGAGGADLATKAASMKRAGARAKEIAKTLGISSGAVYRLTAGVKRGQSAPAASSGPRRRCGACEQVGTADPCEHCGEAR